MASSASSPASTGGRCGARPPAWNLSRGFCLQRRLPIFSKSHIHACGSKGRQRGSPCAIAGGDLALNDTQTRTFWEEGYLVLPNFASKAECSALRERANELVDAYEPDEVTVFSTTNQEATSNRYFLDSAANISYFFEEGAAAAAASGGSASQRRLSINKIGHALHDLDPVFSKWSRSHRIAELYRALGFQRPLPVQSMYIFKQPSIGGPVVPHQDSAFLMTEPPSCVGIWLAVEDATVANGCLHVARRSHDGGVQKRMTRRADGGGVEWVQGMPDFSGLRLEPLETAAGTLVLLHGANVHGSSANTSPESRHAYSMHVVEGMEGFTWLSDNWLQRPRGQPFAPLFERA